MDITAISTALSSINTATDLAKIIKESGTSLEQAEFKFKLAELVSALADTKIELASIQDDIVATEKEMEIKQNLRWERPYYILVQGSTTEGPFCQCCYDNCEKLIRLQDGRNGSWFCMSCKNSFQEESDEPTEALLSTGSNTDFGGFV